MAYTAVPPAFIGQRSVTNPMCLQTGGEIGTCNYTGRSFNIVQSGVLQARMDRSSAAMQASCETPNHCVAPGSKLEGKTAPDGKAYVSCSAEERKNRLKNALNCAKRVLAG